LRFGTFPAIELAAETNSPIPILGGSAPGIPAARRLIPSGQKIPLGFFQVIKSRKQPVAGSATWSDAVDVEVLRFRFTPARGHFYGPPQAAAPHRTPSQNQFNPV